MGTAFSLCLQQLEQQGVHILRRLSSLDQVVSEAVHPDYRQPVLRSVQVDIALVSSHIQFASFGFIVPEGGELVECAKNYCYCV